MRIEMGAVVVSGKEGDRRCHRRLYGIALVLLIAGGCGSSTDALIADLRDGDPLVRRAAVRALGDVQDDRSDAAAALADALQDDDLEVRELAAASLGRLGTEARSSVPQLERALKDPEHSVRVTAALAIYRIDPASRVYVPAINEALRAGDGPVFLEVGRMGADAEWAVPTLRSLLTDRRVQIRALAAQALGEIGPAANSAHSELQQRLRDENTGVRKAAQKALRQIGTPESGPAMPSPALWDHMRRASNEGESVWSGWQFSCYIVQSLQSARSRRTAVGRTRTTLFDRVLPYGSGLTEVGYGA